MGYCRVRITGTRVKANILSGMATTYSGPEEASSTAQAGTSVPSSVRSASVARIFSPIQNTIIMASAEPIVENRRWAVNHQSRGDCCGCCAGGIGSLILIPHSYWPQTDRSHVQYSSRIRHGVSIALGMGEEIINGQGMINVNHSQCRESPLLCKIAVGRHAIIAQKSPPSHTHHCR